MTPGSAISSATDWVMEPGYPGAMGIQCTSIEIIVAVQQIEFFKFSVILSVLDFQLNVISAGFSVKSYQCLNFQLNLISA